MSLREKINEMCEMFGGEGGVVLGISPDRPDIFDEAFMGVAYAFEFSQPRAVYDREKIHEILCEEMSSEEAVEHFDYNIIGSGGDAMPIFLNVFDPKEYGNDE